MRPEPTLVYVMQYKLDILIIVVVTRKIIRIKVHQYMIGVFHTMNSRKNRRLCIMSPHANTWDIHVFRSLNRLKLVKAVLIET